ncbi:ABC transporter ATP-binding protein [Cellulomonas fimi]|uniref:ABC-type quaternary amine transporter n=1 Tax=Cellulomonas fimi (strain ATCC 484 / DSM 20113 / JCM 1341 / CCUG 24087 / LMG 16345 / NBRC 15513 / NCIMB 8980 / NCTC 7547 / NRS-133) TaxID=590998 RepID=F4H5R0_CELFA|nr:ATP-binding cassette domain-containing protein [Cellulomonas fimi]AEE45510.1 ABC transporter related protein [Cellulomonas fimi ATCC 484]NNH07264.1 ATP-binding cassette domain-containing protein [Cellulomonas fimi]VEH29670.1 Glycine betaine/L-proline transport ATP-binding protein ProV [Cellulomonas fimi]
MVQPAIAFEHVRKEYPTAGDRSGAAVDDLSLDVRPGEVLVLVGPSGCGKSTTLRMANRLVEPTSGRILLEGDDVTHVDPVQLRRRIGYVIQDVGLFPHRTVAQNVATVPRLLGWDRRRTAARVEELLALVGLEPSRYARRYPHELSGGERQRVGVARALATDPPVLLMDEPFGAVDPVGRRRLQSEFARIQREVGTTVMLVTHDIDEAVRMGDRVAVLSSGAHVEQLATPLEVVARPATDAVADLVGRGRLARLLALGRLTEADVDTGATGPVVGRVALGAELGDVLGAFLAAPGEGAGARVEVLDGDRVVGSATSATVLRALRRLTDASHGTDAPPLAAGADRVGTLPA